MALTLSSNNGNIRKASFLVGNTYKRIPSREADFDRSHRHRKTHDWVLYVDIVGGNPDCIERVLFDLGSTFEPQTFISSCPTPIRRPNGQRAWRFSTRQQSYGSTSATIAIRGAGGTKKEVTHSIILDDSGSRKKSAIQYFEEHHGLAPLHHVKMPDMQRFGIELEVSSANSLDPQTIADNYFPHSIGDVYVTGDYRDGREASNSLWKIVPDSSLICNRNMPYCHKFEVVSCVLQGGKGLSELASVLRSLENVSPALKVNKSMGFHVHIDVSKLSVQQLIKVCQNFIKYEDVMDSFMPLSRRSGSEECDRYCKSNRDSVGQDTNKQRHVALENCYDVESLADMINYDGRYYKLNLQNLVSGRQPTMEFRQHSATLDYTKVSSWIRFCTAFVNNSARLASPKSFQEGRDLDFQFYALFQYVIKDRALREFYNTRRHLMSNNSNSNDACCTSCHDGHSCDG